MNSARLAALLAWAMSDFPLPGPERKHVELYRQHWKAARPAYSPQKCYLDWLNSGCNGSHYEALRARAAKEQQP